MSTHETLARAHNWAVGTLAGVILFALVAYSQTRDAADDKEIRTQVAERVRGK